MAGPRGNMSTGSMSMGDWLMEMFPTYMAQQGLDPPADTSVDPMGNMTGVGQSPIMQNATASAPQAPQPQIASVQPNEPRMWPTEARNSGSYFNDIPSAIGQVPQKPANDVSYFADIPSAVAASANPVSPAEEQAAKNAVDTATIGQALSGVQALQNRGVNNPGAPGVPGTRGVDANLLKIIQSLSAPAGAAKQLKTYM